jgi:gliding motility-associated-like protein
VITAPADYSVECMEDVPDCHPMDASAYDNCSDVTITCTQTTESSESECGIVITNTYTATDACGNSAFAIQTIIIEDTTPPDIAVPGDISVQCLDDVVACNPSAAVAIDNCSEVTITCTDSELEGDSCNGTIIRTYTATDACGNVTSAIQTITIQDTIPPVISVEAEITVQCYEDAIACNENNIITTDNCSDVIIECSHGELIGDTCTGIIINTYTATDACGNESVATQMIIINDDTPPDLVTEIETEINTNCDDIPPVPELEFSDNCTLSSEITIEYSESSTFINTETDYEIFRTWVASDTCGNESDIIEQTINVSGCDVGPCSDISADDISNAVTPNGDGRNETFVVSTFIQGDNSNETCTIDVIIINRWGAKIFEAENYQNDWGATTHDNSVGASGKVPTGTYFYIVKLKVNGVVDETITGYFYVATN